MTAWPEHLEACVGCTGTSSLYAYGARELLGIVRPSADYPRNASYLNSHFNEMERRIIFALLEEIIEQHYWHGIQWWRVWKHVHETPGTAQ